MVSLRIEKLQQQTLFEHPVIEQRETFLVKLEQCFDMLMHYLWIEKGKDAAYQKRGRALQKMRK